MKYLLLTGLIALPQLGLAGEFCTLDGTERFACTLKGGQKYVEVCDAQWLDGFNASYGYMTPGQSPELEITQDMASMTYEPWNGMGNPPWASVTFTASDHLHRYRVWYHGDDGGITVLKGEEELVTLDCDPGTVVHDLDQLIDSIDTAQISP